MIAALLSLIVVVLLVPFLVKTGFLVYCAQKKITRQGVAMRRLGRTAAFWDLVGAISDVLYNAIHGSWQFKELPRWGEWAFSWRVERHAREDGWRGDLARGWALELNAGEEGHIHVD